MLHPIDTSANALGGVTFDLEHPMQDHNATRLLQWKTTLETSGEQGKTTLETSGEDVKNYTRNE